MVLSPRKGRGVFMNIVQIEPIDDRRWERLVALKESSVFHSTVWLRVLHETYALPIYAYVLLNEENQPVAGIPYSSIQDPRGRRLVSLPFSDFCDPLVTDAAQWNCLIEKLLEEESSLYIRCLHNTLPLGDQRFDSYNQ